MIEELTAMFRVCKHIKGSGDRCNSPAMTGMNFCFHHIGGKVASLVRQGATYDASAQLDFDYPADRESIQQNLFLVAQALREGKIDNQTANTYIRIFRLAEQNLYRWEKKQKDTGKSKMSLPQNDAKASTAANTDVIPSEAEEPALPPALTTTDDVIPSEREEPAVSSAATNLALPPGGPLKPASGLSGEQTPNKDVIPSEAEEPAVSTPATNLVIPANPRPKSPEQQRFEDIYYGRIPAPSDL